MRILSWNLNVRRACAEQVRVIAGAEADIALLQEVTVRSWDALVTEFRAAGFTHLATARDLSPCPPSERSLTRFSAIASRLPFEPAPSVATPAPEPIAVVRIESRRGPIDVFGVHIPTIGMADKLMKIETQEALAARLEHCDVPVIVGGDFNSPLAELPDGTCQPFFGPRRGRWHEAERRLMGATTECGLVDVFRAIHSYERQDVQSWWWKNRGKIGGYRLDHIFASPGLTATACDYIECWPRWSLSDHAAIFADFPDL